MGKGGKGRRGKHCYYSEVDFEITLNWIQKIFLGSISLRSEGSFRREFRREFVARGSLYFLFFQIFKKNCDAGGARKILMNLFI